MDIHELVNSIMWEGDRFKTCHISTVINLKDFINMRNAGIRTVIPWEDLKHCHVTEAYRTIWSITESYFEKVFESGTPIGQTQPPTELVSYILNAITAAPTTTD
jgi:hypothetical protein